MSTDILGRLDRNRVKDTRDGQRQFHISLSAVTWEAVAEDEDLLAVGLWFDPHILGRLDARTRLMMVNRLHEIGKLVLEEYDIEVLDETEVDELALEENRILYHVSQVALPALGTLRQDLENVLRYH